MDKDSTFGTTDGNGYTDVLLLAFLLRFPVNLRKMVPKNRGKHTFGMIFQGELDSPHPSEWVPPWRRHLGKSCSQRVAPNPYRCPCAWPRTPEGKPQTIAPVKLGSQKRVEPFRHHEKVELESWDFLFPSLS